MHSYLPNLVTFLRIALVPMIIIATWQQEQGMYIALFLFSLAAVTDLFDGYIARRSGSVSAVGAFLDPIADKILISSMLIYFASQGMVGWWVAFIVIGRDALVTYLRTAALHQHISFTTTRLAKWKTFMQILAIYMLFMQKLGGQSMHNSLHLFCNSLVHGVAVLTLYTGVDYSFKYYRMIKSSSAYKEHYKYDD